MPPTNHSASQKTSLNDLPFGIKIGRHLSSFLSQCMRLTDGRTDEQTDRQTDRQTDSFLIAIPRLHAKQRGKTMQTTIGRYQRTNRPIPIFGKTADNRPISVHFYHYYFRFLRSDVRRIGILLPVSILTYSSSYACHFASAYQISSKSVNTWRSFGVIPIFKDGAHRVENVLTGSVSMTALA